MNCLENDEADQYAAAQGGCHGPARRAPSLVGFDIRRNMPHRDGLTFHVTSPRHTSQECQARSIRPPGTASATSAVPSARSRADLLAFLHFPAARYTASAHT